uniref:MULE transposase domain-containing protein n=1 Tax=Plectus sambesii TaxID=2011161 RepID=A0A914WSC2_9BILA
MEDCVEFVENCTNKGKAAAIYEGYTYLKDMNLSEGKKRYKCIHRSFNGYIWILNGWALTMKSGSKLGQEHNHEVEPKKIKARKRLQAFKTVIKEQPNIKIGNLVLSTRDCEAIVTNAMPTIDNMKRMGRDLKRKYGPVFRVNTLEDIDMTLERSRITIRGPAGDLVVNFVLHDSGVDDKHRMLMFGTTNSIASLGRSSTVHADGTFRITPEPFKQAIQSFGDVFGVPVEGCYFHFAQAIMRNARRFDIFKKIARSPLRKHHYIMIRALAFLPPGDIPSGFDALTSAIRQRNYLADFVDLLSYMEETWVAPMCPPDRPALGKFPPLLWSVHTRTLTGQDRTNNRVEGWHFKINTFMEHSHLAFYVFLDELKKFFRAEEDRRREDHRSAIEREARRQLGEVVPVPYDNYSLRSAALQVICQQYQNQRYVTNPQSTGLIRFLSEVADILLTYE